MTALRFELLTSTDAPAPSPARTRPAERAPFRVGAVQVAWSADADEHAANLRQGVTLAAGAGARIVCLQELTLSPYFAVSDRGPGPGWAEPEPLEGGPTHTLLAAIAAETGVRVHGSLYEAVDPPRADGRGFNTAIVVAPDGSLVARTRKVHIPVTAGYHEDRYFLPGDGGFPVVAVEEARFGFPTCWDQWFPELSRAYSVAGAEVLVYPTAIGSEPDHPDFDTQPLWQQVIVGQGIANGTFMVAVNRIGTERLTPPGGEALPAITFYGSSFVSDPYGRVLVQAPRERPAVLVADLDLDARRDWLELFPFLTTRRPDQYGPLTQA
ncbi:MAG TPA: nitrilase-related carbon-nitrogen hydrolase [Acidimicrobiales bacterium]|nr:nitrilase-related carbon-nitrogen hydrolase [Acidimicrobiales bacterium]